ncbi:hypothetical protein [Xanthobacter flavus]|uniref:hypothetical protein n=1 Tax=Xanthobacter flavus TaxID=281 RepID=UPI003729C5E7
MGLDIFTRGQSESLDFARQHLAQDLPPAPFDFGPWIVLALIVVAIAGYAFLYREIGRARGRGADLSMSGFTARAILAIRRTILKGAEPLRRFAADVGAKVQKGRSHKGCHPRRP